MLSNEKPMKYDAIIVGGGAAGLMCARVAGMRGRKVLVLEKSNRVGGKIWIAGGGRCNFTNRDCQAKHFYCANPHFVKSALARWQPVDMVEWLESKGIEWEERDHGRLFCCHSAGQIVNGLQDDCRAAGVAFRYSCTVRSVGAEEGRYVVTTSEGEYHSDAVVVALGGAAWPQGGGTTLGYEIARQFGLEIIEPKPGLAPLLYGSDDLGEMEALSGASGLTTVRCGRVSFTEETLFTHRGLSGPAILQISCVWQPGEEIVIDWLPGHSVADLLREARGGAGSKSVAKVMEGLLPARFVRLWEQRYLPMKTLPNYSRGEMERAGDVFNRWRFIPAGIEEFSKAETTLGGVSVAELSSRTMGCKNVPGLYFVGEVVDVAGQLGGYNLHWAWASGNCAGEAIGSKLPTEP